MTFQRFVQTGRVALVSDGPYKGNLVSIVDVIDQTRVLVDGPQSNVPRQALRLNQLHLTKFRIKFPYTAPTRIIRKAWEDSKVEEQWKNSTWSKKLEAKKKRLTMSDFDRFKLRKARSTRNKIRTSAYHQLKKAATYDGTLYGKKSIKPKKTKTDKKKVSKK